MEFQELTNYIVQQLKTKLEFADVKKALLEAGWDEKSVDEAYQDVLSASSLPILDEGEHAFERFSPHTPLERTVKRVVIFGVGGGLVILVLYIMMR